VRPAVILVGTPIGNLGDLSPRAVEALTTADVIAAEDTRRTRPLLTAVGVPTRGRLVSFHGPNEVEVAGRLVERIVERRERLVCVTDAGMPGISDPGERLVVAALAAGVAVEVVPGPSAALSALVLSGLPTGRFVFEGFLPRKGRQRAIRLEALRAEDRTIVVFEAPHQRDFDDHLARADRAAATMDPRSLRTAKEAAQHAFRAARDGAGGPEARGEQVIVIGPAPPASDEALADDAVEAALRAELADGASTRDAAAAVAGRLGVSRRRAYTLATSLRKVAGS